MKKKEYDIKFLRTEILENMLNNNPLAIRLVTSNLPKNKNLQTLGISSNLFEILTQALKLTQGLILI